MEAAGWHLSALAFSRLEMIAGWHSAGTWQGPTTTRTLDTAHILLSTYPPSISAPGDTSVPGPWEGGAPGKRVLPWMREKESQVVLAKFSVSLSKWRCNSCPDPDGRMDGG